MVSWLVTEAWAMDPFARTERRAFWEICEDHYQNLGHFGKLSMSYLTEFAKLPALP